MNPKIKKSLPYSFEKMVKAVAKGAGAELKNKNVRVRPE